MTNLDHVISEASHYKDYNRDTHDVDATEYIEDIARLKLEIPELASLTDQHVADVYGYWSEELNCAGWLILDYGIEGFATWLRSELFES